MSWFAQAQNLLGKTYSLTQIKSVKWTENHFIKEKKHNLSAVGQAAHTFISLTDRPQLFLCIFCWTLLLFYCQRYSSNCVTPTQTRE